MSGSHYLVLGWQHPYEVCPHVVRKGIDTLYHPVLQGNRPSGMCVYMCYKELAHVVTEAEKSQDLLAGDPGEPVGVVPA